DEARFIAVLGVGRTGDEFHLLQRIGRDLRGERLALLVADRLAIHHEGGLSVIAEGMKKAVGVGRNSSRAVGNGLAELPARIERRQFEKTAAVNVSVRG